MGALCLECLSLWGHTEGALQWAQGQLQAKGQGACTPFSIKLTTAWAGWGHLVAEKKELLWARQATLHRERVAPQAGEMAL